MLQRGFFYGVNIILRISAYDGAVIVNFILIFALYSLCSLMMYFKHPKHILLCNVVTNSLGATYLYINDAQTGFVLCLIAASSSAFQLIFPMHKENKNNQVIRNGMAVACSIMAVLLLYSGPSDLLICSSIIFVRLAEAQLSSQSIRVSVAYSSTAWALYSLDHQLYFMLVAEVILMVSASYAVFKNYPRHCNEKTSLAQ